MKTKKIFLNAILILFSMLMILTPLPNTLSFVNPFSSSLENNNVEIINFENEALINNEFYSFDQNALAKTNETKITDDQFIYAVPAASDDEKSVHLTFWILNFIALIVIIILVIAFFYVRITNNKKRKK